MRAFYPVEFKLQRVWASARAGATGIYSLIYIKLYYQPDFVNLEQKIRGLCW